MLLLPLPIACTCAAALCVVAGCLLQFIRNRKELSEKTEVILDMAVQICSAMNYLESNGFIHRDLVSGGRREGEEEEESWGREGGEGRGRSKRKEGVRGGEEREGEEEKRR